MKFNCKKSYFRTLYIHFISIFLLIFFFSTEKLQAKSFEIRDIEVSKPFEINFNKDQIIDEGFKKAFFELISQITKSSDQKKIEKIRLSKIKGMIESFTIKEEKFINDTYFVNVGVTFNKKKVHKFLEENNIFPSVPEIKNFLVIPIIIDEKNRELLLFSNNEFFENWNNTTEDNKLIKYILPTEDLEDLNSIKKNFDTIEEYDFNDIINKYNLNDSIVILIFKNKDQFRVLSKITIRGKLKILNKTYDNDNFENSNNVKDVIENLKIIYEDQWKQSNQINTSIKLPILIKVKSLESKKILKFEEILNQSDLVSNFKINKFDKDFIFYNIIFNGTTENFIKLINDNNYNLNTQNKTWILK
tara:strand:- start:4279 stop:5358 length:1080 start_codon:yes stop_codon:yes gene_type:complete